MSRFHVILKQAEDFDVPRLSQVLAPIQKKPLMDVTTRLRQEQGFLAAVASDAEARALQGLFAKAGIETIIRSESELVLAKNPHVINWAQFDGEGITSEVEGGPIRLLYRDILLICSCHYTVTTEIKGGVADVEPTAIEMALGVAADAPITGLRGLGQVRAFELFGADKKVRNNHWVLDLVGRKSAPSLRIEGQYFDFSCLGPHQVHDLGGNVRVLVKGIAEWAPAAATNRGAHAVCHEATAQNHKYDSLERFEREKRWLLQVA